MHHSLWALRVRSVLFALLVPCALLVKNEQVWNLSGFLMSFQGLSMSSFLVAICAYMFHRRVPAPHSHALTALSICLAILFAAQDIFGENLFRYGMLLPGQQDIFSLARLFLLLAGYTWLYQVALLLLLEKLVKSPEPHVASLQAAPLGLHSHLHVFALFLVCWLPYYIVFFPGLLSTDSYNQIAQGLGGLPLMDDHPILHTFFLSACIRCGRFLLGSTSAGVALYASIQMLCCALVFAFVLSYMDARGVPRALRIVAFCFFAFHPIVALYAITLWKDIYLALFTLLYTVCLCDLVRLRDRFFASRPHVFGLTISILGMLFSKNTGVVVVVLSLLFVFPLLHRKRALFPCILTAVCALFAVHGVLMPALDIQSGRLRETLSIPIQQLARTAISHRDELSTEDVEALNGLLPLDQLSSLYDPKVADPVKAVFDDEALMEDPGRYVALYLRLGMRYPSDYLQAFLCNTVGYWAPNAYYWFAVESNYADIRSDAAQSEAGILFIDETEDVSLALLSRQVRSRIIDVISALRFVPLLSMCFSAAFGFRLALIFGCVLLLKRRRDALVTLSPTLGIFVVCMLSPVFVEFRYVYPAFVQLPLLFSLASASPCFTSDISQ